MGVLEKIKKLLGIEQKIERGRVSVEPISVLVPKVSSIQARFINPRYPREFLLELERLVLTNPDLSHAHQIFLDLAATDIDVIVDTEEGRSEIEKFNEEFNLQNFSRLLISL